MLLVMGLGIYYRNKNNLETLMYIINLNSDVLPTEQPWGTDKVHVPLNIRETETIDEDGLKKTTYVYDVVEKVPVPVTIDNIVNTAAKEKFGEEITSYVAANIYKSNDETVKSYTEFAKSISEQAEKMGYN